jgi:PhnB protein
MSFKGPSPYFLFPGTATAALQLYQRVFGGDLQLNTFGEFGRTDGPADAIAHGVLSGDMNLYAADAGTDDTAFGSTGLMFSLLGVATPDTLRQWFDQLAEGGTVVDPLQHREWGATDGQVRDPYGVTWLIGFEDSALGDAV